MPSHFSPSSPSRPPRNQSKIDRSLFSAEELEKLDQLRGTNVPFVPPESLPLKFPPGLADKNGIPIFHPDLKRLARDQAMTDVRKFYQDQLRKN